MFIPDEILRTLLRLYGGLFGRAEISGYFPLPKGPKIIAANHTLASDAFHLPLVLDEKPYFMMQHNLFDLPLFGPLLKLAGQIPVERNGTRATDCLSHAYGVLAEGKTIVIFPEGELVPPGKRIRAKTGVVHMALEAGVPIIPLGMYVAPQNVMKFSTRWQGCNRSGLWQVSGKCLLNFGAPWRPSLLKRSPAAIHALTDELMNHIYSLVAQSERESRCVSHTSLNPILR